ncbi:MAG: FUN14 domain-containing protein, partial [Armatimonadota bacterium]
LLGCLFIILQLLAFHHFIEINWGNIAEVVQPHLSAAGAGDAAERLWPILVYNVPFGGAFVFGFVIGFRKG